MIMQENYQPVVLRKILLSKGATREEIKELKEKVEALEKDKEKKD